MHERSGAVLLTSIHPRPLLYQQPQDVILPPRCCEHAQRHTTDILQTHRYKAVVSDEGGKIMWNDNNPTMKC